MRFRAPVWAHTGDLFLQRWGFLPFLALMDVAMHELWHSSTFPIPSGTPGTLFLCTERCLLCVTADIPCKDRALQGLLAPAKQRGFGGSGCREWIPIRTEVWATFPPARKGQDCSWRFHSASPTVPFPTARSSLGVTSCRGGGGEGICKQIPASPFPNWLTSLAPGKGGCIQTLHPLKYPNFQGTGSSFCSSRNWQWRSDSKGTLWASGCKRGFNLKPPSSVPAFYSCSHFSLRLNIALWFPAYRLGKRKKIYI